MKKLAALLLIALGSTTLPQFIHTAHADDFSINICITLYPCDDQGDLLPAYADRSNPCYANFAAQCYEIKKDLYKQCTDDRIKLKKEKRQLKRRINR